MPITVLAAMWMTVTAPARAADAEAVIQVVSQAVSAVSVADLIGKAGNNANGTPRIQSVPALRVLKACEDCKFGNALRLLVIAAYQQEAEKYGLAVDNSETTELSVTGAFARPSFLRGTFGVLAGADYITCTLGDKTLREFSISHEMGIDGVASMLGERALQYVVQGMMEQKRADVGVTEVGDTHARRGGF